MGCHVGSTFLRYNSDGFRVWNPGQEDLWELIRGQEPLRAYLKGLLGAWPEVLRSRCIILLQNKVVFCNCVCICTSVSVCTAYSDTIPGNITCLCDECVNTELDQFSSLETIHVHVWSAETPLIRRLTALFLSTGMHAFLHSNSLIYSLLKLNTAANTPSDSITLCPHGHTNEACTPLIKCQSAIEMFKICVIEWWRWRLP